MAANSAVTLPFTFNGEEFVYGRVRFNVGSMACVDGFDFGVPAKYALMLLSGNEGAWHFLEAVAKTPLLNKVRQKLLGQASLEGLTSAWKTLSTYIENAPDGSPRFYKRQNSDLRVDLTDGLTGVSFYFHDDLKDTVSKLPVNVYCETREARLLDLNLSLYTQASAQIEDFFRLACRIAKVSLHTTINRIERCMQTYFTNRAEAYRLLAEMERDAAWRREREALWDTLKRERVVRCAHGFIVINCTDAVYYNAVYYVTDDGQVFKFNCDGADLKEAVLRTHKSGKPPKRAVEVEEPDELGLVAKFVAKITPELAIVVAP
jgi:hypothetical protein